MSYLFGTERRAATPENWGIPAPGSVGGGNFSQVDLRRTEASLQKVAVWACVALVRSIVEMLPLDVFAGADGDRREIPMPSWLADLGGDGHGLADWCSQATYSGMLRGNEIGLIEERSPRLATPTQIVLQHPDQVRVHRDYGSGQLHWYVNGVEVDRSKVWHQRVNSVPGHPMGLSPIETHALTIGTGIAAMRFGSQWFEDGAHPSGLLVASSPLGQTAAKTAKQRFMDALRGTREPIVLGQGWKYQAIQIAPNESQFLETNQFTGAECCRIFGPALAEILGYETGGSLTYANIEQRSIDLLTFAVDPWLVRLERALGKLLPDGQFVKFNRGALLRTDLLTRFRAHAIALQNRFKVVNEVRDDEDMTKVAWGDEPAPVRITGPAPADDGPAGLPPASGGQ